MNIGSIATGQIYEDLDYRMRGRRVRVISFEIRDNSAKAVVENILTKRRAKISLSRMREIHNGFRLVENGQVKQGE